MSARTDIDERRIDFRSADREYLLEILEELHEDLDSIKYQIASAKRILAIDGEYSDPDWWIKINSLLRLRRRQIQKIQHRLGLF